MCVYGTSNCYVAIASYCKPKRRSCQLDSLCYGEYIIIIYYYNLCDFPMFDSSSRPMHSYSLLRQKKVASEEVRNWSSKLLGSLISVQLTKSHSHQI